MEPNDRFEKFVIASLIVLVLVIVGFMFLDNYAHADGLTHAQLAQINAQIEQQYKLGQDYHPDDLNPSEDQFGNCVDESDFSDWCVGCVDCLEPAK